MGADGQPIHEFCIDPVTAALRLRMYELYVSENWSCGKIARHFNEIRADGGDSWTQSSVRKLLGSPTAIGVFLWNRTRREYDAELDRWVVLRNPSSQWAWHFDRALSIVPLELWRAARRKLAHARKASPLSGRPQSRNELQPTTLFSGTLRCACCREELKLVRSTPAHKQLGSLNGINKIHGCRLSTSKSTRIIEECLLEYLRDTLLTKEVVVDLVERANRCLAEEAARPRINVAPLRQQVAALQKEIERYRKRIGKTDDDSLADGYEAEIRRLRQRQQGLNDQIRSATSEQSRDYSPISVDAAMTYLADLRRLLNSDISVAGPLIRELTGPIFIREERDAPRRRRSIWIASFQPQCNAVLRKLFPGRTLGTFADTTETCPVQPPVEVHIRQRPRYERLAPEIQRLHAQGSSISEIAVAFHVNWNLVRAGLQFAKDGTRPPVVAMKKPSVPRQKRPCFYMELAPEIARLRDVEKLSIPKIAKLKGIGVGTVSRAYNYAHRQAIKSAIEQGAKRPPAKYAHLRPTVFERIRELKDADMTAKQIAAEAGCSVGTVRRELLRLQRSAAAPAGDDEPRAA